MLRSLNEPAHLMVSGIDSERLIAYEIPRELIERYQILVEKEKTESISTEEKSELDSFMMINHVISLAKLMAMKKLAAA